MKKGNKIWIFFIKFPVKVYFYERIIVESEKRDLKMRGTSLLKTSEENLSTLKRNNGTKQGGRGRRRG